MRKSTCIKKIAILLVFLLSFVFQTAYSISFQVSDMPSADYFHKHIDKASAKEELSEGTFIEKETENDNELDFELLSFVLPQFFYQVVAEKSDIHVLTGPLVLSSCKGSICIATHNFRI